MASILDRIKTVIIEGDSDDVIKELTRKAIDEGFSADEVIKNGLVAGIEAIGKMWKEGEAFIPEVVRAAEVMQNGMSEIGEELISKSGTRSLGRVVIGTVKGDVHAVGKSLVMTMLSAVGFTVSDLGVDVAPEKFVEQVRAEHADLVCMSALLTTTMPQMARVIEALREAGIRVKTMVGGAPVTQEFASNIGASGYAPDAVSAVDKAKELLHIQVLQNE